MRSSNHDNNILTSEGRERAWKIGVFLSNNQIKLNKVVTSPQLRAIETALKVLVGAERTSVPIYTNDNLDALSSETEPVQQYISAFATKMECVNVADFFYKILSDPSFRTKCKKRAKSFAHIEAILLCRAQEGADFLIDLSRQCQKQSILVVSHGLSRIEMVLLNLEKGNPFSLDDLGLVKIFFAPADMVELTFISERLVEKRIYSAKYILDSTSPTTFEYKSNV